MEVRDANFGIVYGAVFVVHCRRRKRSEQKNSSFRLAQDGKLPVVLWISGTDGPTALILGGVHGNEPAGAVAAERICSFAPVRGRLVVVPRINPLGLERNIRYLPEFGDMNRAYPPSGENTPAEKMGEAIISLMERYKISLFIDLHEARTFHRLDKTSLGQTLLFADNSVSATLAMDAVDRVNLGIAEPVKKFALVWTPDPWQFRLVCGKNFRNCRFYGGDKLKTALGGTCGTAFNDC